MTPEQFEMLSFGNKILVITERILLIWLDMAKKIWPILVWRILMVLKDIRKELIELNKKTKAGD